MTAPSGARPAGRWRGLRPVAGVLAVMTAVQAVVSMVVITVPIFAVTAAPDIGVDARVVGFYSALVYVLSTVSAPIGGHFTDRIGPARTSQLCMLLEMLGIALVATAWLPLVALGAILIGAGNGPATPASTFILSRRTPPALMSLVLSIKQTGTTIGTAIAGVIVPLTAMAMGWRGAALVCAGIALAVALAIERLRREMDREVIAARAASSTKRPAALAGIALILRNRRLAVMAACGFSFCMVQVAVTTYFVTFLVGEIGLDKAKAAYLFSLAVSIAVAARIAVGGLADWLRDRNGVLAMLGLGMGAAALWFMLLPRGAPAWEIALLGILFTCCSWTWTGVFLAEIVPFAPEGQTGTLTGAMLIFVYAGSFVGPGLFGLLVTTAGSYPLAFAAIGVPALSSGFAFLALRQGAPASRRARPGTWG